jgi:hypothetical protein
MKREWIVLMTRVFLELDPIINRLCDIMNPNPFTQIDDEINDVFDELQMSQKRSTFSRSSKQEKNSFMQGISPLTNQFK